MYFTIFLAFSNGRIRRRENMRMENIARRNPSLKWPDTDKIPNEDHKGLPGAMAASEIADDKIWICISTPFYATTARQ